MAEDLTLVRVADLDGLRAELGALRAAVDALRTEGARTPAEAPRADSEPARAIYMSPEQFARHVGVTTRTIRSLVRDGLPAIAVSRYTRIPVERAERWLEERRRGRGIVQMVAGAQLVGGGRR